MSGGRPTFAFYIAVLAVIGGLIYFAGLKGGFIGGGEAGNGEEVTEENGKPTLDPNELGMAAELESDESVTTTVKDYEFVPSERLPPVKGTAAYNELEDNTIRFAINVWAGWAPIIHANNGAQAGKIWKTPDGKEFKVQLVLVDNPVEMRDGYAAGEYHIGWATVDMMPLFMQAFVGKDGTPTDSRVMPRVFQQIDWSNGGDGIVVRKGINTVADLKGKTVVLAQNSPSQYFLLRMLVAAGLQPSDVKYKYTDDAFKAAAAFNSNKDIAACVSWAPDIYTLSEQSDMKLLVSTVEANKLIADIWFARADFAKDHPDLIEGLVRGIFDSTAALESTAEKQKVAKLMSQVYPVPQDECLAMLGDAHWTNFAENRDFFLNQNNPTRFENVWNQAYYIYRRIRSVQHTPVTFDKVVDFSVLQKLAKEEKYASQKNEYRSSFTPKSTSQIEAESEEILSNSVIIHFAPNQFDPQHKVERTQADGSKVVELYDPNVEFVLDEISQLVGQFGACRVVIEGHTDSSKRGQLPDDSLVKELSGHRANAVKEALVQKYDINPDQVNSVGRGWDRPSDSNDPLNHAKNRRVEVRVFTAEAE